MKTRIVLADDHQLVIDGLRAVLEADPDIEIVGIAVDGREAIDIAHRLRPDLVVMDLAMPELNGMEATRQIRAELPATRIICLSMHAETAFVAAALEAGASGYILKERAMTEVLRGIRVVMSGETYLCSVIAGEVLRGYREKQAEQPQLTASVLSPREVEVLQLLAEGHGTREISDHLHLSMKTVSSHREHIMEKLDIHSIAGLTKYAIRHGLTTLDRHRKTE